MDLLAVRYGSLLIGAGALALGACSAGDEADGMPTYGNVPMFGSNGTQGTPGTGIQNNNGGVQNPATNGSASNGSNNNANPSQPNGSQPGSAQEGNPNGAPISNGNTNGAASTGAMAPGAGGAGNGAMAPGAGGASNGAMAPGAGGVSNGGNQMPTNGTQNPPPVDNGNQNPPPPAAPDITCPSGAIFCSGFEGTGFPSGTTFEPS
jgi:hypothetical protein